MEEVFTTQTFSNTFGLGMVIGGDDPIPSHLDEIVDLELFSFEKKRKKVIRQKHKIRKINLDSEVILTTETMVMDIRKMILSSSTSIGLVIFQANESKFEDIANKMKEYERKITLLVKQVNHYKFSKYQPTNCIDCDFIIQNKLNNIQKEFCDKSQHVQAYGQDIVGVMTHIHTWELAY
jgi:hypothetical protein